MREDYRKWEFSKILFSYDGPVPFADCFLCKKSVLFDLKRTEKDLLYGGTERNGTERNGTERNGTERNRCNQTGSKKHVFSWVSIGARAREGRMLIHGSDKICVVIARRTGGGIWWFTYYTLVSTVS